ncbi:16S rRNA (cytosine(1402)-N(4))-methyltransferase RsmH [Thermosynechococcus sp. B0]|uniref:16S rRNA (cytosine(1402)-N(4))-methyltransferase RsmH n=1 Tax=Thermosynechococcus sp. B0 TaxID=2937284 RepID=UPI0025782370|nr:16S rRNA (cytosine(1402)-N(4))-methyltransferase RsmH [Thermosynechococcus sp. B0]WJI25062.1 16S rRNA (cytosine(1402)-N(4))-methyltransferase RsmH [Thermosynechococcus sp. B0]
MQDLEFSTYHQPVLASAVLEALQLKAGGLYLDATVGGGGHTALLLRSEPTCQVLAIDQDPMALAAAQEFLAPFGDRVQFWHGNFADLPVAEPMFDGILADLGVSSAQLDRPERGFSFRFDAPLDMRMNPNNPLTAATVINHYSERELADIFYEYGEERFARRIARHIVARRPLATTQELAQLVAHCLKASPRQRIHPATRVFQALRIYVNQELAVLDQFLARSPQWLKPAGRIAVISFHSLEDRRVKQAWRGNPLLEVVTRKPIVADAAEVALNPRSRSAKLRIAARTFA